MPRGTQDQGGIMPQAGGNYGLTELEQMTTGVPTDDIEISSVDALSSVNDNTNQVSDRIAQWHSRTQSHDMGPYELNNAQKMFIQSWFTRFGQGQSHQTLVFDEVNALATSIKAPTPLVWGYIYNNISTKPLGLVLPGSVSPSTLYQAEAADAQPLYTATSLADLNPHIPPTILPQVEKYIQSAQGRLSRNDGRRRVNDGPLLCSFGCGYHTKRPYDWRRHEETHCPQDLWMCAVCRQEDEQNAFLVNRKDKCLKHVRNKHQNYNEEEVVDKSNLGFCGGTSFRCPHCAVVMATWEERCKHVLLHYEEDCGASQAGSGRSD